VLKAYNERWWLSRLGYKPSLPGRGLIGPELLWSAVFTMRGAVPHSRIGDHDMFLAFRASQHPMRRKCTGYVVT
jgi:hypothetical protein